jgi:dCTP deaminase
VSLSQFSGWIPGVLSKRQVKELCKIGYLQGVSSPEEQIDYSSVDLTITDEGYEMTTGSVKPFGEFQPFLDHLIQQGTAKRLEPDSGGVFTLFGKHTYLFRLQEKLGAQMRGSCFHGQATAKSSVGRVDVLARLIVDGMDSYECFHPKGVGQGNGQMFLEITPITFSVKVKKGVALSQLRLFYGKPDNCEICAPELYESVLIHGGSDGCLAVDLSETNIASEHGCAFRAKSEEGLPPIPLWDVKSAAPPDPKRYWILLKANELGAKRGLQIEKEYFYILRSKALIALPSGIAVYCRAIDETIGEMRIHYAGFVHPFFGRDRTDNKIGTPLIFEVRGHDVKVVLTDGEILARLMFYRMSEDCIQEGTRPYSDQTLQLSNFFGEWT